MRDYKRCKSQEKYLLIAIIFRYTKSGKVTFNVNNVRIPYSESVMDSSESRYDKSYRSNKVYSGYKPNKLGKHPEDWWTIQPLMPSDKKERTGYPTQKPIALLEHIVNASSNPDDLVLDPFCGCGTTLMAAQRLSRQWVGIDLTYLAIGAVKQQIEKLFPSIRDAIIITGTPENGFQALDLARSDPQGFEGWSITHVLHFRSNVKKVSDGSIDGMLRFSLGRIKVKASKRMAKR